MMDLIHKEGPIMLRRAANSFGTANVELNRPGFRGGCLV